MREQSVFIEALEKEDPAERAAFLDQACALDPDLRERIERLLRRHQETEGFLRTAQSPSVEVGDEPIKEAPGTVIGHYKLLEQIGEGGFGVVFMAEQTQPVRRKVALKVLKPGMDTRQIVARFEAERQALALMDHPNIAHVFDGGETVSGRPYFVMELVRGIPVTDFCDQSRFTLNDRLELFVHVCQAVQHAHQKGIIHRDLKPSNVMVTLHDGTPVAKVIDFGIAKSAGQQLTDKTLFTNFAQLIGTPLYMSPEQAALSGLDVDTRSDIYSLGVLLYELLTGTTPFDKERFRTAAYDEIRRIIREEEPPTPSTRLTDSKDTLAWISAQRHTEPAKLTKLVRGELDWIVMKSLEKERSRRYETVGALARDIERYLHDEAVLACPPSSWYRFHKLARRNKTGLIAGAFVAAALFAGAAISLWQAIRATEAAAAERRALLNLGEEQKATRRELGRTHAAEVKATRELFDSLVAQARANRLSRRAGQRFRTLEILRRATGIARQLELPAERFLEMRNETIAALALTDLRVAQEWKDEMPICDLTFGNGLRHYARSDTTGIVYVRRAGDGAEICRLSAPAPGNNFLALSPDGRLLAVWNPGCGKLEVWKVADQEISGTAPTLGNLTANAPSKVFEESVGPASFGFSPDSRQIAVQHPDRSIGVFDVATKKRTLRLAPVGDEACLAFNPRGRQLALSCGRAVEVHDVTTGKVLWQQTLSAESLEWHPDGKTLGVVERSDDAISLWDVGSGKRVGKLEGGGDRGAVCAFNHAGTLMAGVGWSSIVRLWDPRASRLVFSTHGSWNKLRFSEDDRFLAAWQHDNTLSIWEVGAGSEYRTLTANPAARGEKEFESLAISPDGRLLAAGADRGLGIWDCASGKLLAFVEGSPGKNHVLWEPSGALLAMGQDGLFRRTIRRPAETGELQIGTPERLALPGVPLAIAQSRDGRVLASAQFEGAVVLHRESPDRLVHLGPHADVRHIAVTPDGHWVVTGSFGGRGGAKVWDARTGKAEKELFLGDGCYTVFSPDGKRLVTGAMLTRRIRLWEVGTWAEIPFKEPVKGTYPAFSPDGKLLVVESGAGVARLLDPASGTEFARLEDPNQDRAHRYSFSKDGSKLVTASGDGRCLHIWDLRALRATLADMGMDWSLIEETRATRPFPEHEL